MKKLILTSLLLFVSTAAFAAGPFYLYETPSGGYSARTWAGGTFKWKYDEGPLGTFPAVPATDVDKASCEKMVASDKKPMELLCQTMGKCGVVMCIEAILKEWSEEKLILGDKETKVATNSIKAVNAGSIGKDITHENFSIDNGPDDELPEKTVLIVFDDEEGDEGILAAKGYSNFLGLTGLYPDDNKSAYYTGGWVILNGKMAAKPTFPATIMHELGHLMGLDHSQLQTAAMDSANNEKVEEGVPTMYPYLLGLGDFQFTLHVDDIISLAMLYPTSGFKSSFCQIEGDLKDADDDPYQGINVVAYADGTDQFPDSRSSVSGAIYPPCSDNKGVGHYILAGLVPGVPYHVIYEPVYSDFRTFTNGVNPFNEDVCDLKPGLEDSGFVTFGGKQLVACSAKAVGNIDPETDNGLTKYYSLNVSSEAVYIENKATISAGTTGLDTVPVKEEATSGKKGWCGSLMGGVSPVWGGLLPVLAGVLLALRLRKQNL